MGREAVGLVLEACIILELWELLETLIANGLVEHSCSSNLVYNLIEKRRSDLVCLCLKHVSDLQTSDILCILKYFLSPPKDAYSSMAIVRKEWESQALCAIETATDMGLSGKILSLAKEASVLLMVAHDEFSVSELCLNYLLASSNLDEVILSSCISKLNDSEMKSLIRYLGKWLKKYERLPQVGPCPKASSTLSLKACVWVPTLVDIVKCLGLVLDEHFSSLVLHLEFHEELRSVVGVINSLALEARISYSIANVIENLRTKVKVRVIPSDKGYTHKLIEKLGFLMGREVVGLVLEACIVLELWELLETLIANGLVEHSCSSNLVYNLIEKRRSDLVCLCLKHVSDLQTSDILCILKYFLSPPKDAYSSMAIVRKEWESQALCAIETATDMGLSGKILNLAKEASVLLMVAHDEFSVSELCLNYLLASSNLDEVILSSCISKLNGLEMKSLIRYLGKWLKKYESFPQAGPCPKASSTLSLKACVWVPTLVDIVKCLGLVLDEHFSSLVLHPEFHEELRSVVGVVNSLALEARISCSIANVIENLRTEVKGA
ncbi:hypothetical protein F0562_017566 [Nyssa sinensis]|uniref:Nucleolar protein 11 C-terminal domain-containing protein n=1 Tax=Nyssa sinensis TaxID=561372 RepID=A0A5J4ZF56_9ASTE|nr:hypothetical protein F0562_017566 [Nyssa sinensis]